MDHRIQTRQLIHDEVVNKEGESLALLGYGYEESMNSWERFWENIFQNKTEPYRGSDLITSPSPISLYMHSLVSG